VESTIFEVAGLGNFKTKQSRAIAFFCRCSVFPKLTLKEEKRPSGGGCKKVLLFERGEGRYGRLTSSSFFSSFTGKLACGSNFACSFAKENVG